MKNQLKNELKDCWNFQKLMNHDFTGGTKYYLLQRFKLSESGTMGVLAGTSMVRGVQGYHINKTIAQVSIQGDEDADEEHRNGRVTEAYSFTEMCEKIDRLSQQLPGETIEVFIGYEVHRKNSNGVMDVCCESDVRRHHVLIKDDKIIEGSVKDNLVKKDGEN